MLWEILLTDIIRRFCHSYWGEFCILMLIFLLLFGLILMSQESQYVCYVTILWTSNWEIFFCVISLVTNSSIKKKKVKVSMNSLYSQQLQCRSSNFYYLKHLNYNRTYNTFHLFSLKYFPSPDWFNKRHTVYSKHSPSNHNENVKGQGRCRNTSRVGTKPFCI